MRKKLIIEQVVRAAETTEFNTLEQSKLGTIYSATPTTMLARAANGQPQPQVIGDRIYTYGIPFKGKSGGQYWIAYDGAVLTLSGKNFVQYYKDGKPFYDGRWPNKGMENIYLPVLKSIGLESTLDIYQRLSDYKARFQELINQGAQSNFFNVFNQVLNFFYPDGSQSLVPKAPATTFSNNIDAAKLKTDYGYKVYDVQKELGLATKDEILLPTYAQGILLSPEFDKVDKQNCQTRLKEYFITGVNKLNGSDLGLQGGSLEQYKGLIRNCYLKGMYEPKVFPGISSKDVNLQTRDVDNPFTPKKRSWVAKLFGAKDRPEKILSFVDIKKILDNSSVYDLSHIDTKAKASYKESKMKLDNIIREQLVETSNNKKRLLQESKIINLRFKMIVESVKSEKSLNDMYVNLLSEMIYLHKQGFDNKLIAESAEGVFGVLSNLFGKSTGSIVDTFKEKGVEWIINKLGLGKNSFLKNYLITTLGNTDLMDVPKLFTDCSFLTKKMAESIPEAYLRKLEYEKGMGNVFVDVVRNSLYDVVRNSDLAQKLENNLASVLCPLVDKMSSKFSDKLENMKTSLV